MLLIVAAVIALIMTGVFSSEKNPVETMTEAMNKVELRLSENQVRDISHALNTYLMDNGDYPETLESLIPDYLRNHSLIIDPWRNQFKLDISGDSGPILVSAGPDGQFHTIDDIQRRI